jgi:hypothetical protein
MAETSKIGVMNNVHSSGPPMNVVFVAADTTDRA